MSFSNKKADLIKFTKDLINCLKFILSKKDIIIKYDKILEEFRKKNGNYDVQSIIENLENSLSMVERSTMKCVFIGDTSNGKSCTINAVLKQIILPSDIGRTTSCFVNIMGYEGHEIYLEDMHGKKCPVVDLQRLGDQLSDQACSVDSLLRIFIPRNICELLENDVEIIDCPGAGYSPNHDAEIINHCKDSDLFVLVLDGIRTLNESEITLFKKLKGHLSNLIIVVNKWDLVESSKRIDRVRKQHQDEIIKFLVEDLAMYSLSEAQKRFFFISSLKEVEKIGSDNNPSLEFNRFKDAFIKDSNEHAIEFKIKKFHQAAQQKKKLTLDFLSDLKNFIVKSKTCDCNTMEEQIMMKSKTKISEIFKNINEESEKLLHYVVPKLTSIIREAMETTVTDDKFIATGKSNLVLNFCKYFENNIKLLPDQIKDICVQHSCIDMHGDKMERFSKLSTDLDKPINEYKEHIENNIKKISLELKKKFRKKKNKKEVISGVTTSFNIISPLINAGSQAAKIFSHPVISCGLTIGGALISAVSGTLANKTDNMNLEDQIRSHVERFFSDAIEMNLPKLHHSTDIIVTDCLNKFIKDQRKLLDDLLMTFNNWRLILLLVQIEKVSI